MQDRPVGFRKLDRAFGFLIALISVASRLMRDPRQIVQFGLQLGGDRGERPAARASRSARRRSGSPALHLCGYRSIYRTPAATRLDGKNPRAVPERAIAEFVPYVRANEPGTKLYQAWQQKDDPKRFVHFFIFEDEAAHAAHAGSAAVKRFEAAYRPELSEGDVVFTDYQFLAANRR